MEQKKPFSNAALILANLVPLVGIFFLHWDAKGVFVIYIIETMLIGALNVVKMLTVYIVNGSSKEPDLKSTGSNVSGLGIIPFFIFHYFFFIFVQSVLFFAFSSIWHKSNTEPFQLIANFTPYFYGTSGLAVGSLLIANLTYFTEGFIMSGKYRTETMTGLMFQPYKRIILQQFVVILGGFIFMLSGSATAVAVLFVVLKIAADYVSANYNRNKRLQVWIASKATKDGKKLSEDEKMMVEKMFEE